MADRRPSSRAPLLAAAILVTAAASAFVLWPQPPPPPPRAIDEASLSSAALGDPEAHALAAGAGTVQERAYWPPLQLTAGGPEPGPPTSPERAALAYARAVRAGDWEGAQALVEPESRRLREAKGGERGVGPDERAALWRRFFGEHDLVLTHRATVIEPALPGVVFLATARVASAGGDLGPAPPLVLRRDAEGRWWVTDAFVDHPAMRVVARAREPS